jgi:hypothetical protein
VIGPRTEAQLSAPSDCQPRENDMQQQSSDIECSYIHPETFFETPSPSQMRRTLRRSCAACAKAKLRCDLQTPRCSRCAARNYASCVYANQPLVSETINSRKRQSSSPLRNSLKTEHTSLELSTFSAVIGARDLDPFDTYPATSLPRSRVQSLIHHCEYRFNVWP